MALSPKTQKQIVALWNEGHSASMVAAALHITRNQVIGIVHRNQDNVIRTRKTVKQAKRVRRPKEPRPPQQYITRVQPSIAALPPPRLPVSYTLNEPRYEKKWTCQYFIGSDMCGKESQGPWCEEHKKVVHVDRSTVVKSNHKAHKIARLFRI